jgi:uncharacterized membrane protein
MSTQQHDTLARQAEVVISQVLRGGVILSAGIIGLGALDFFLHGGHAPAAAVPYTLTSVWQGVLHGDPLAIIMLGLLVLLATPVLRVAVSILAFALEGDRRYVVITTIVLLILVISFLLGKGGG